MADNNQFRTILDGFIDGSAYKKPVLPTAMQAVSGIRLWQPPVVTDPLTGGPMAFPPGASIQQNIQDAKKHFLNIPWFYDQVHQGGPWDYKQLDQNKYHDAGNFNYGATGAAAGFPLWFLDRAAGWAQKNDHPGDRNPGKWYGSAPYGDDPNSQTEIEQGFAFGSRQSR